MTCPGGSCPAQGGLSDCFTRPADLDVNLRVRVNKKSVLQIYCLCSPDEIFEVAPRFSFQNNTGNTVATFNKTFKVNRNQHIAYKVVPAPQTQGENRDDLRQGTAGLLLANPNQIQVLQVTDGVNTVDARPYVLSTADNPRSTPVADDLFGQALVGANHEANTQDPPTSGALLGYLPIGYKGLTTDNAYDIVQGATPRTVSTLDSTPGTTDELILSTYFPQTSMHNEFTYFYTSAASSGTMTPTNNPFLESLTAPGDPTVPNVASPEFDFNTPSFISPGPVDASGAVDTSAAIGNYLQTVVTTSGPYAGVHYIALTIT